MSTDTKRALNLAIALSLGLPGTAAAADTAPLFAAPSALLARNADAAPAFRALRSDPAATRVDLVRADSAQIREDRDTLLLNLAPGLSLTARKLEAERTDDGVVIWQGTLAKPSDELARIGRYGDAELIDNPAESAILVRNGDNIAGTVRTGGKLYRIDPLANGGHAISLIDESRMPPDHPASAEVNTPILPLLEETDLDPNDPEQAAAAKAPRIVRVMVVYTQAAAKAAGDTLAKSNLAIAESNRGFANSGVNVRFQLAGRYVARYTTAGFSTDLSRFRGTADGYLDGYHRVRNTIKADLNVLVTTNAQYCGMGYLNASAAYAFSVVNHGCMTGYYTFAHEIGHNFGAHHDPANASNTAYPYGHGYWDPRKTWRTIMAYNCGANCTRVNYWSNPNVTYRGVRMGTTTKSHNARVLNQRAAAVAGFR